MLIVIRCAKTGGSFNYGRLFKDVTKIKDVTEDIMNSYGKNPQFQFLRTSSMNNVSSPTPEVNPQNGKRSLKDSDGNKLSEAQVDYFKDSLVRDDDGNLRVMFHGSGNPDFTSFKMQAGSLGKGAYFTSAFTEAVDYGNTMRQNRWVVQRKEDNPWL